MPATPAPVTNDSTERQRIIRFLATFDGDDRGPVFWERRLRHWWDANPFCCPDAPRGFVLHDGDAVVGFFGLIPQQYVCDGRTYPALAATTWRVDTRYRTAAASLFVRVHRLTARYLLTDCTPSAEVREVLDRAGYERRAQGFRAYLPLKRAGTLTAACLRLARMWRGTRLPLDGATVVTLEDDWTTSDFAPRNRPRKRVTRHGLAWFMAGVQEKWFRGLRDRDGRLVAYVIAVSATVIGLPSLHIVEYGSSDDNGLALCTLLEALAAHPDRHGVPADVALFSLTSLENEPWLERLPLRRLTKHPIPHYYSAPPDFPRARKYALLTEGDVGL